MSILSTTYSSSFLFFERGIFQPLWIYDDDDDDNDNINNNNNDDDDDDDNDDGDDDDNDDDGWHLREIYN